MKSLTQLLLRHTVLGKLCDDVVKVSQIRISEGTRSAARFVVHIVPCHAIVHPRG